MEGRFGLIYVYIAKIAEIPTKNPSSVRINRIFDIFLNRLIDFGCNCLLGEVQN